MTSRSPRGMTLTLYNSATRQKDVFEPIDPANVRMYVCGPTVYDFAHIGNGRSFVSFDLVFRLLRHLYGPDHVTYVRNITDIDDKINARAAERGVSIDEVTAGPIKAFHEDMDTLNCLRPTIEPRATEHLAGMIAMIETLIGKGHAYAAEDHVLFDVSSMADYGKLSGRSTDEMVAGARVEVAPYKRNPMDFVLWKPSDDDQPGWDSPWGVGRPGWHLECSVMSEAHLGQTFDIHGGGIDLLFPHHENEVAQSTCAHDGALQARYWLHGGYLQVEGEKMSKSLGNFRTVHDLIKEWPGEALRLQLLMTHYRQPLNWTVAGVREAKTVLDRWYRLTEPVGETGDDDVPAAFVEALCDDVNAPKALAVLHELAHKAGDDPAAARALKAGAQLIGLVGQTVDAWNAWRPEGAEIDEAEVERLIAARAAARKDKNFAEADRIRDQLADMGVVLEDGAAGTTWKVAS